MKIENQGGWLAIEAMAAVLVMLISIPMFYSLWAFTKVEEEQAVVAGQLKTIGEGFEAYVLDNYTDLIATSTPTTATLTSFATMKAGGYVRAGVSSTNMWGQGYANYVLEPKPGTLEIITITSGGTRNDTDFLNQVVPGTASKMGSKGGYTPSGLLPGQAASTMQGSFNGWQRSFTGTNIPNPGAGHLVYYTSTNDIAAGQDFLYRKSVPGNPQLNTMETNLNMGNNAISSVGSQTMTAGGVLNMNHGPIVNTTYLKIDKNGTTGQWCPDTSEGIVVFNDAQGLLVCRKNKYNVIADTSNSAVLTWVEQVWNGGGYAKPACPAGTGMFPQIYVAPSTISSGQNAKPMSSIQAWTIDYGTWWRVQMRVLTDTGWVYPNSNYARGIAIMTCEKH